MTLFIILFSFFVFVSSALNREIRNVRNIKSIRKTIKESRDYGYGGGSGSGSNYCYPDDNNP